MPKPAAAQPSLPIQPVEKPIICGPYVEPDRHWVYDTATGRASIFPGRRPASYWFKTQRTSNARQTSLFAEETRDDLPLVNALRDDVRRWRESNYERATNITKELLRHWWNEDRPRRLFFCQLEAVETILYLNEIRGLNQDGTRRGPRFTPKFTDADFDTLADAPNEPDGSPLTRYGCKMATGSGKTVVMAMLIAWAFCNRGQVSSDERFPRAALVCCPNLTVKERLQVLRPDSPDNYYAAFDIVPARLRSLLGSGKVLVTNWHAFSPESEHAEGGRTYPVVDKGEESADAFARRVLDDLYDAAPLMVLNDEAHHAYRPAPIAQKMTGEEGKQAQADREEATVWVSGLDRFNAGCGVRFCVDLSATPFYLAGSGYAEGAPFPWLVSDFGLVDAIESGIVKIPRLPTNDTSGRPEAKFYRLWDNIKDHLQPADFVGAGRSRKPKANAVWREAQDALNTLASQWMERFGYHREAAPGQEKAPPVMILVCDNTDIAQVFFENISGERQDDASDEASDAEGGGKAAKKRSFYGDSKVFAEFANGEGFRPTLRIDTKLLAQAESDDPNTNRQAAAQELRRVIATVGKPGEPGEHVRCVVSVAMLTEGWDANNVTHILGLRAFGSQLLCEQVVGRGLRRMDYTVDPQTGLLTEEYVDVYGIPFTLIPFKGHVTGQPEPVDRPKNHVQALDERTHFAMQFPNVEGYAFALRRNLIRADVAGMEPLAIEPNRQPTAVFVRPSIGYMEGPLTGGGPGEVAEHDRQEYYASTHLQTIEFEIARQIIACLVGDSTRQIHAKPNARLRLQSRQQLFPQVLRFVHQYIHTYHKVDFKGEDPRELGLDIYVQRMVERFVAAIEPDDDQGEPPLVPILNRYKPQGTTGEVDFKTTRTCYPTTYSHLNQVALDTATWESSAAFRLEQAARAGYITCYARNEQMGLLIPYEYQSVSHVYEPDFLVRLADGRMLILEVKGYEPDKDKAKHQAAQRWISAVNNCDKFGDWLFDVCYDPHLLLRRMEHLVRNAESKGEDAPLAPPATSVTDGLFRPS